MSHSYVKDSIEEYAEERLSPEAAREVEQHLAVCGECQQHLAMIRLTRGITLAAKLEDMPVPAPGFSRMVLQAIEQQQSAYLLWRPLHLVALRAIPLLAVFALILAIFAYWQMTPLFNNNVPRLESYLDLPSDWDREGAVFSDAISRDPDRVAYALMQGQAGTSDSEREPK
jgi:putative zinc finger protein